MERERESIACVVTVEIPCPAGACRGAERAKNQSSPPQLSFSELPSIKNLSLSSSKFKAVLQCWCTQVGFCPQKLCLWAPVNQNYHRASLLIKKKKTKTTKQNYFLTLFFSTSLTQQFQQDLEFEGINPMKACNNKDLGWEAICVLW